MVEDKAGVWAAPHQLDRARHLGVIDTDVKREAVLSQHLDAAHETWLQAELRVRLRLDEAADALDQCLPRRVQRHQHVEEGAHLLAVLNRRRGDDPLKTRVLSGALDDPLHLQQLVLRREVDFHVDHRLDVEPGGMLPIFRNDEAPVQARVAVEPGDAEMLGVPEMDVRVDDREVRHAQSSCNSGGS